MYSAAQIVDKLHKILPAPGQFTITEETPEAFRFVWKGDTFRVSLNYELIEQETDDGLLAGTNLALVLTNLVY